MNWEARFIMSAKKGKFGLLSHCKKKIIYKERTMGRISVNLNQREPLCFTNMCNFLKILILFTAILLLARKQESVCPLANGVTALPSVSHGPAGPLLQLTMLSPMKVTSYLGTPLTTIALTDLFLATTLRWCATLKEYGRPLMA